ncbi:protein of unknown function [Moritella yayanosii]|uniref:Uncharacterized protein n=1 Tax=Moritella yayanosii TaxID=69539 RepID=A0A330LKS4_9GAMM|nr:protein of unknown function [Moritella yayanosii]
MIHLILHAHLSTGLDVVRYIIEINQANPFTLLMQWKGFMQCYSIYDALLG